MFLRPEWLWLAAVGGVLALLAIPLTRTAQTRLLRRYAAPEQLPAMSAPLALRFRPRWILRGAALAMLALALAGPLYGEKEVTQQPQGAALMIALDVSPSMAATDIRPSRLARARHLIGQLLPHLAGHPTGLVLFSGQAHMGVPLTLDREAITLFLDAVEPGMIARKGSSLEVAVTTAVSGFGQSGGGKALIILSDGETTDSNIARAAATAKKAGVEIYGIGVATPAGAPIPVYRKDGQLAGYKRDSRGQRVISRLERGPLTTLASATGGQFLTAEDDPVATIAAAVETLALGDHLASADLRLENRYQWPLAVALLILLAELLARPIRRQVA